LTQAKATTEAVRRRAPSSVSTGARAAASPRDAAKQDFANAVLANEVLPNPVLPNHDLPNQDLREYLDTLAAAAGCSLESVNEYL